MDTPRRGCVLRSGALGRQLLPLEGSLSFQLSLPASGYGIKCKLFLLQIGTHFNAPFKIPFLFSNDKVRNEAIPLRAFSILRGRGEKVSHPLTS